MLFDTRKRKRRQIASVIISWTVLVLAAVLLAYLLISYVMQTTTMMGQSMSPVIENQDRIFVHKLSYQFKSPKRFDVIVFESDNNENSHIYIKRIIGLPGETVQILDGQVYINNNLLEDTPFTETIVTEGLAAEPIELGEDEYFVMGDNVNNSEDSRSANIGNISRASIVGKVNTKK